MPSLPLPLLALSPPYPQSLPFQCPDPDLDLDPAPTPQALILQTRRKRGNLEHQMPDPVQHQHGSDDDARELQDGDLVPGLRHTAQARRAALQRAGEGREGFVLERPYVRSVTVGGMSGQEGGGMGSRKSGGWRMEGGRGRRAHTALSMMCWSRALS